MPTITFAGPEFFEHSKYYNPSKSYINNKKPKPLKVNHKQKAAEKFYTYFIENEKTLLPKALIIKHRAAIENLILQGCAVDEAYNIALSKLI